MLTPSDLQDLQRDLADTKVLSVYLGTGFTDPAMRAAWKPALQTAIREARSEINDEHELAEFDRAAAFLREPEPSPGGTWGAPGWVAFVTANGPRYIGDIHVGPGTMAAWRNGPVIAPYLRALKQLRPVIVALVESASTRLFRYATGALEALGELAAPGLDAPRSGRPTAPSMTGTPAPAPRGATGSDLASRRQDTAFERLVTALGERLVQLGGSDSWILVGGTREWAGHAGEALARQFTGRVLVSATLDHDASDNAIIAAAKDAATELRAMQGGVLVDQLIEQGGGHARSVVGVPATQRALRANAVDLLLVTPQFISAHAREVEDFVRATIAGGADVEVPSGRAAEELDRAAGGVAARLRFAIDEPPATGKEARE